MPILQVKKQILAEAEKLVVIDSGEISVHFFVCEPFYLLCVFLKVVSLKKLA